MNIPNAGPQLPAAASPQHDPSVPLMPTPPAIAQLGCMGCGDTLPNLGEVVKPPLPLWLKILGVVVFFGGVFGLMALADRGRPRFPAPPSPY